jgi:hypothetical protein
VRLLPISAIENTGTLKVIRKISEEITLAIGQQFDAFSIAKRAIAKMLLNTETIKIFPLIGQQLAMFENQLKLAEIRYKKVLCELLPEIRSCDRDETKLLQV